ncbi:MAG: HEAT repeat domain-containing protein [Candidatus Wallbacteria bacterium]|nr:HEAT repeat domain-containing protein [Candidatus Wallbacteria bacterium]
MSASAPAHAEPQVELVVCPPWRTECPHLALACLSSYLRSHGVRTRVRDFNAELYRQIEPEQRRYWDLTTSDFWARPRILDGVFSPATTQALSEFVDSLVESPASILGFSCQSANVNFTLGILEELRARGCRKLIVFGGPSVRLQAPPDPRTLGLTGFRPTGMNEMDSADEIQRHLDRVDVFVEGEGEETLLEVVRAHLEGGELAKIPGAIAWTAGGRERPFVPRPQQGNLDLFPAPTFEEFDLSIYQKPILPFLTSRGCVRKCAMCYERILWPGFRHRSVEHIVAEMRAHQERYGINQFSCNDLLLNGNLPHLGAVCDAIAAAGLDVGWWGNAVVHRLMDRELFRRMKAGGIKALVYGIESGSQKVLRKMRKGYMVDDADHVLRLGGESDIYNVINLIVGFPGETEEDHELTMEFVRRNHAYVHEVGVLAMCIIYPHSPLAEQAEYYGVDPQSLLQLNPFTVNTTWEDTTGLDEVTRTRRFWELHRLIRGYGIPVVGVEDEEELTPARVEELCGRLADPTVWVREDAVSRLKRCSDPAAVPHLLRALEDESYFVAGQALLNLAKLAPERAWAEGTRLIRRRTPLVDRAALIAIAGLFQPESFDYMEAQLVTAAYERADPELKEALTPFREAYQTFEQFDQALQRGEVPSAAAVLTHPQTWVRRRALHHLMAFPEAARALTPELSAAPLGDDPDEEVRYQALELMLTAWADAPEEMIARAGSDIVPRIRALAAQGANMWRLARAAGKPLLDGSMAAGQSPPPGLQRLWADWEQVDRRDWREWLGEAPDAAEAEYRALVCARRAFEPHDPAWAVAFTEWALGCEAVSVRIFVLDMLRRTARPGHDEAALAHLAHGVPMLRRIACQYLGAGGDRRHEHELARALGDADMWVSESAAAALGWLRSPLVLRLLGTKFEPRVYARLSPWLQEGLAGCRETYDRMNAMTPAMRSGEVDLLSAAFEQADALGRACLMDAVARSRTASEVAGLTRLGLGDAEEEVRLAALDAVAASGDAAFSADVLALLDDPVPLVRGMATRFLATVRFRAGREHFLRKMEDPDPLVKEWAVRGLGRLRDPETLGILAELVSDSIYRTLRPDIREDLAFHRELAMRQA